MLSTYRTLPRLPLAAGTLVTPRNGSPWPILLRHRRTTIPWRHRRTTPAQRSRVVPSGAPQPLAKHFGALAPRSSQPTNMRCRSISTMLPKATRAVPCLPRLPQYGQLRASRSPLPTGASTLRKVKRLRYAIQRFSAAPTLPRRNPALQWLWPQCYSEARMGFEPTYNGFANRCLTTWLPRRFCRRARARLLALVCASTKDHVLNLLAR